MFKSWEAHKAEMKREDKAENRKVLFLCLGIFCFLLLTIAAAPQI